MKAPSQLFRWFEKMKSNYERNIRHVLEKFEQQSDQQQLRQEHQHLSHISTVKDAHRNHVDAKNETIAKLEEELIFYKQQIQQQQETIHQLNSRYDAIVSVMLNDKSDSSEIKDILASDFIENDSNLEVVTSTETPEASYYEQALAQRANGDFQEAFNLFSLSAQQQDSKSMGALARAYFLSEGVEQDEVTGLAWLINAAQLGHAAAQCKVEQFEADSPNLFNEAKSKAGSLLVA